MDENSVDGGLPELAASPDLQVDLDTEPIYWRLKVQDSLEYHDFGPEEDLIDDDGDDCLSDDAVGLDLTAPPPESWYHGRISRQTACARLQNIGDPGAYLIRESETQPGDYAISYLSRTRHVHHFKINSNCGDYYIGGRQFFSLGDLIGFYANCSCILQNESLEVPVVPPQPVPLYLMLRATAPHTKTPGTDELSIVPGEVFVLLSRLNDDWGWGRSQQTMESGLIPIVIMEDVKGNEPNLGKVWFHGSITREDAVNLLMRRGDVGSFLVRTGSTMSDSGEVRYSMAVKTPDRVQRFLITKFDTGYYVFGGRPFNTIEDIIDRYKNEVILDGIRLGTPVAQDPILLQRMQADKPPYGRTRTNSVAPKTHGDMAGKLLLRKGKKSPVSGKWKEFFFVLKYEEQKLLYYDHENSHRAKGLLDLKQCRVYAVHPSLYGKGNCFVVMLRYLNELAYYYISADTAERAQDWLSFLRQCTHPSSPVQKPEVQQLRSLALSMRDCKLAKGSSQVYSLVSIDGACIARTRVAAEVPCIFDENYHFEDLPPYAQTLNIDVHTTKNKGFPARLGRDTFGRVLIHLSDLPNGQNDDQWHQLLTGASKTPRGSLRLVANYKHEVILPLDEYRSLKELLLGDNLTVIEALANVCKDHHAQLASTLVQIFCHYNRIIPITTACIAKSIEKEENVSTLFRANTLSTMLMDQFMKLHTSDYLESILKEPIQQILESADSCELNPNNLARGADLTLNLDRLEAHLQNVITSIFSSTDDCLPTLRYIFRCLQDKVVQKWPTDETVRTRSVSGFLFLRFICPALLKPQLFRLITEPPSPTADRTLKLVTKGVQKLASLVEFRSKEPFMTALNPFIVDNLPRMQQFIDDLANYGIEPPPMSSGSTEVARDLATIYHLCCTYEKHLSKIAQEQAEVGKLLKIMQALNVAEKKYLNESL